MPIEDLMQVLAWVRQYARRADFFLMGASAKYLIVCAAGTHFSQKVAWAIEAKGWRIEETASVTTLTRSLY